MSASWPEASDLSSVSSAGLGKKDTTGQIVFASIQSIYKDGTELQWRDRRRGRLQPVDLVIVDEAHLIPHKDVRKRGYSAETVAGQTRRPSTRLCEDPVDESVQEWKAATTASVGMRIDRAA
jgi:hypothetical protein